MYLVPEHLFGKSEHLFGVSERLFVFGHRCSLPALLQTQRSDKPSDSPYWLATVLGAFRRVLVGFGFPLGSTLAPLGCPGAPGGEGISRFFLDSVSGSILGFFFGVVLGPIWEGFGVVLGSILEGLGNF